MRDTVLAVRVAKLVPLRARLRESVQRDQRSHRRQRRAFYAQFVHRGDVCFDIGANVGNRAGLLRSLGARVIAVEPQPALAAYLRARYPRGVTVVEAGAGSTPGVATLHLSTSHTVATMSTEFIEMAIAEGRFEGARWVDSVEIAVTTLDELISLYGMPAFVKIDVEGFEPEVLRGLTISIPALSFEFVRSMQTRAEECVSLLAALDVYEFNFSEAESMRLGLDRWVRADEIIEAAANATDWGDVYARTIRKGD
jgi:FkbM family methyltransferase